MCRCVKPKTISFRSFRFLWSCIVSKVWREKTQQDATIRCLLLKSVSTCFGHHYAHLQENKGPVTAFGVLFWFCTQCSHPTRQRPTTATNHIQQNQNNTPIAVTGPFFSWRWAKWCPKHVETEVNNKHQLLHLVGFSLFIISFGFANFWFTFSDQHSRGFYAILKYVKSI